VERRFGCKIFCRCCCCYCCCCTQHCKCCNIFAARQLAALRFIPFIMSVFISFFFHCQKYFKWVQSKLYNAFYLVLGYPFHQTNAAFIANFSYAHHILPRLHRYKDTQIQIHSPLQIHLLLQIQETNAWL